MIARCPPDGKGAKEAVRQGTGRVLKNRGSFVLSFYCAYRAPTAVVAAAPCPRGGIEKCCIFLLQGSIRLGISCKVGDSGRALGSSVRRLFSLLGLWFFCRGRFGYPCWLVPFFTRARSSCAGAALYENVCEQDRLVIVLKHVKPCHNFFTRQNMCQACVMYVMFGQGGANSEIFPCALLCLRHHRHAKRAEHEYFKLSLLSHILRCTYDKQFVVSSLPVVRHRTPLLYPSQRTRRCSFETSPRSRLKGFVLFTSTWYSLVWLRLSQFPRRFRTVVPLRN